MESRSRGAAWLKRKNPASDRKVLNLLIAGGCRSSGYCVTCSTRLTQPHPLPAPNKLVRIKTLYDQFIRQGLRLKHTTAGVRSQDGSGVRAGESQSNSLRRRAPSPHVIPNAVRNHCPYGNVGYCLYVPFTYCQCPLIPHFVRNDKGHLVAASLTLIQQW